MPLLDRQGLAPDPYRRLAADDIAGAQQAPAECVLVPWADVGRALGARRPGQRIGAQIENTLTVAELKPLFGELSLIAIGFPAFSDGRGFSLAKRLRNAGYVGRLRAVGPLIADQFAYALACGFDEVEPPEALAARQPVEQWLAALGSISGAYQRGYGGGGILDQRRAARASAT